MSGSDLNLSDDELKQIVTDWRNASPNIVKLWWDVDGAVKKAVQKKEFTTTHGLKIGCKSGFLFVELPSGRSLAYVKPRLEMNRFGSQSVTYEGVGATKKWERIESYGPKFVENVTQAIARDLLLNSMKTLSDFRIVAHVHDELIIECNKNVTVREICEKMSQIPDWAKGLNLRADGYECEFYRKD